MKISEKWLKQYVNFKIAPDKFSEKLSMLGLEVESYENLAEKYKNFVVGKVLDVKKHPNADKLTICKVDIGNTIKDIICGAPNVEKGQKVPVALVGAKIQSNLHDKEHKPFILQKAKIRGIESDGMICSEKELGLSENSDGILILDSNAKVGASLAKYLGMDDTIYEIGITPNRADCLSHIGVAREVAVLAGKKVRYPKIVLKQSKISSSKIAQIKVEDKKKCPRYSARVILGVKIGPSPKWLQDTLTSIGLRPINNVVDVTNYVLMEYGHPLHAFDLDKLDGGKIIVKTANQGDRFVTLDGKERILSNEMLMICDAKKPVAIAGVMGGANTEISESTQNILIESAYFEPSSIRRTSKQLGLSTEASYRFERGTDIEITVTAANRAAQLIQQLAGGEILKDVLDVYHNKIKPRKVRARISRINNVIGTSLLKSEIIALLNRIEIKARSISADEIIADIPTYRNDVVEEIDIIEEVARLYGYNNIETKTRAAIDFSSNVRADILQNEIREYLIGAGFNEILTISLQDEETMSFGGECQPIKVLNPVSEEMSTLRPSLVVSALHTIKHNLFHGVKDLRLFEIGNVFWLPEGKTADLLENYKEEEHLLLILCGNYIPLSYGNVMRKIDILDMKGEVSALLSKFCLDNYRFIYYDTYKVLCEQVVKIEINNIDAGFFGKVRKQITDKLDIDEPLYICELSFRAIQEGWVRSRKFKPLPRYPSVIRDLAFIVDALLPQNEIEEIIWTSAQPLCKKVTLFDMYIGQNIGAGKKSLAYSIEFQKEDRTLTDDEVDKVVVKIIEAVTTKCNGVLRKDILLGN